MKASGVAQGHEARADARGQLRFPALEAGRVTVELQAPGFYPAAYSFELPEGTQAGAAIQLQPLGAPLSFTAGQPVPLRKEGLRVLLPPDSLEGEDGQPVNGLIQAFLSRLDPDGSGAPVASGAPLLGLLGPDRQPVGLEAFASVAIQLQQEDTRVVAFARRGAVDIDLSDSIQATPRLGPSPGAELFERLSALKRVPAWRFDVEHGGLRPVAYGTLRESSERPGHLVWQASDVDLSAELTIALPFYWRSQDWSPDAPLQAPAATPWAETSCLAVRVEDGRGRPVAGRLVTAQGVDYLSRSQALTDSDGRALLEVMRNHEARVDAGAGAMELHTGAEAGNCQGQGAEPVPVTLAVPAVACVPGTTLSCPPLGALPFPQQVRCQDPLQTCGVGGMWGPCLTPPPVPERCGNGLDDDCDGQIDEGCVPLCAEGQQRSCFAGPAGTRDVGRCRAGAQVCQAQGMEWSACQGQVLPARERCDAQGEDEDCDGQGNEGCLCRPEAREDCYDGPALTQGQGVCRGGTRECFILPGGRSGWSGCEGEVTPTAERCDGNDWNCDGEVGCTGAWDWSVISRDPSTPSSWIEVSSVKVDPQGNTLVAGRLQEEISLAGTRLAGAQGLGSFLLSMDPAGTARWSRVWPWSSSGINTIDALATDALGHIILVGDFSGSLDFGAGPLIASDVEADGFVAVFNEDGTPLWSTSFQASELLIPSDVAVNTAGTVFVTGTFTRSFPCMPTCESPSESIFLRAYSSQGAVLWTWHRELGPLGAFYPRVATDHEGRPVLLGNFDFFTDFGGSCGMQPLPPDFPPSFTLIRFTSEGNCLRADRYGLGDLFGSKRMDLAIDASDSIFVGEACNCAPSTPSFRAFLWKLDASGGMKWARTWDVDTLNGGIAVDPSGFLLVSGTRGPTSAFSNSSLSSSGPTIFVSKLNASGREVWSQSFGGNASLTGIAAGPLGHVVLAGYTNTPIDLDGTPSTPEGSLGSFVIRLKP